MRSRSSCRSSSLIMLHTVPSSEELGLNEYHNQCKGRHTAIADRCVLLHHAAKQAVQCGGQGIILAAVDEAQSEEEGGASV